MAKKTLSLRPYQTPAVKWLYSRLNGALFGDLGTGKTLMLLTLIETLRRDGYGRTLLIAPKNVKNMVWEQEARDYELFDNLIFSREFDPRANVHLVNPESMHKIPDWFGYDILIIDESVMFKNPGSVRFKNRLQPHLTFFRRRYILTAGPNPNGYEDLFAQIYICDLGARLGPNITAYRDRFFRPSYSGYGYDALPGAEDQIDQLIADIAYRIDRTDHMTLPKRNDINVDVHLSKRHMKLYRTLEKDLVAELKEKKIVLLSAGSAYDKCKQFTGGFLYDGKDKDKETYWIHNEKLHVLDRLHLQSGCKPFLVVYQYEAEGLAIERRFRCPRISGKTKNTTAILDRWNAKKLPMLCAQIQTIAMGLNLQFGGNDLVVYSIPNNLNNYFQVVGRLHRPGIKGEVNVYHLICVGTIDEVRLIGDLKRKESKQKALLRALKKHFRQRNL